jgi:uncharacterized membrane protein
MIGRFTWVLRQLIRQMWVRAVLIGALGIIAALAGIVLEPLIPEAAARLIGADAVDTILSILASSMLAVVTFSLSVAVQAFSTAASSATPRATSLLQEDGTTQNVLATFVGAFLFSLVGIIALSAGAYGGRGRVILFLATIAVVALVIVALLRWIDHIMRFGRLNDTLQRVEKAATKALIIRSKAPTLGGNPRKNNAPDAATAVAPTSAGYVQYVDIEALAEIAEDEDLTIWLADLPGSFAHPGEPLLHVHAAHAGTLDEGLIKKLRAAFTVGDARTFDQDPRFGLIVLTEIASRALSPAVNDPGTAIDVLGRLVRILSNWQPQGTTPDFPRLHVPWLAHKDLLEDSFHPIARDGAALVEVQLRLQKALAAVAAANPSAFAAPCAALAHEARSRAEAAFVHDADRRRLQA